MWYDASVDAGSVGRKDYKMARTARIKKSNNGTARYHLMSRANDRRFLFEKGRGKTQLVDALKRAAAFSGVVMSTLFAESDAASEMLEKSFSGKDQGKILASMKIISVKELGAGIFAGAGTIMNAIVEDTKKLGGDDSYQIDIGV